MREIKFRAWDKERKVMIGSDYPKNWDDEKDEYWGDWAKIDLTRIEAISKKERFEVMQYTGLKDKNGVEIYEGDVIELTNSSGFKRRTTTDFKMAGMTDYGRHSIFPYLQEIWERPFEDREVLGNIHEHPELLKEKVIV